MLRFMPLKSLVLPLLFVPSTALAGQLVHCALPDENQLEIVRGVLYIGGYLPDTHFLLLP